MPKQIVEQDIDILNIRLPDDIINWIDSMIEEGIFSTRSEVIREIVRDFINSEDER